AQATLTTSSLAAGPHTITATYGGDSSFSASPPSDPLTQTVNQASTTTTLASSLSPSVFGQPVTVTATVAPVAPGAGTPTGSVAFSEGNTALGAVIQAGTARAVLPTSPLTPG